VNDENQNKPDKQHCGAEEDAHHEAAEDEDEDHGEAGDGIVGIERVVGEHVAQDAAGVERGHWQQVEEDERQVHLDGEIAENGERLRSRRSGEVDLTLENVGDGIVSARDGEGEDEEQEEGGKGDGEVGDGAGEGDEVVVAGDALEVAGDDRNRAAPAHDDASATEEGNVEDGAEDHEGGVEEGSEGVDVAGGIEADAAFEAGGLVAETGGHPGLGTFMNGDGEQQDDELKECEDEVDT